MLKCFDESPQMSVFTLYSQCYVCYAQRIQQLPRAEERMIILALELARPPRPYRMDNYT